MHLHHFAAFFEIYKISKPVHRSKFNLQKMFAFFVDFADFQFYKKKS